VKRGGGRIKGGVYGNGLEHEGIERLQSIERRGRGMGCSRGV